MSNLLGVPKQLLTKVKRWFTLWCIKKAMKYCEVSETHDYLEFAVQEERTYYSVYPIKDNG